MKSEVRGLLGKLFMLGEIKTLVFSWVREMLLAKKHGLKYGTQTQYGHNNMSICKKVGHEHVGDTFFNGTYV